MLLATATISNAQWYVGGGLGVSNLTKEVTKSSGTQKEPSTLEFGIMPKAGYMFNDRWSVGLGVGYNWDRTTTYSYDSNNKETESKVTGNTFSVNPYTRFNAIRCNRFSVALEGGVNLGFGSKETDPETFKSDKTTDLGVYIVPVFQFDISRRFMLESKLDFLSLGYNYSQNTLKATDGTKTETKTNTFGFKFDGDKLFTTGALTIGAVYKF